MGQILSDEGDQEEAINCLIDAPRWDSKNGYALLMMGNIFLQSSKMMFPQQAKKYFLGGVDFSIASCACKAFTESMLLK